MTALVHIAEFVALAALGGIAGYLALLSLLSLAARRTPPLRPGTPLRIAVVIPAHNEEGTVARTIRSIAAADYPPDRTETVVIADNCTDRTAAAARAAGATVLERSDPMNRGKGHALRWAFDTLLQPGSGWDGAAVVDADSVVSRNFLRVMDAELRDGAGAVQANDQVLPNPDSWSSEITRLGFTLYNFARPLGRGVLGGSAGLRGNGMCFSAALLRAHPWSAFGVTEDLQYGLDLLLAGVRVRFSPSATVLATMPAVARNAETQRIRWEEGRQPVRRRYGAMLLSAFLRTGSFRLLDAWIDLATPPLVRLMATIVSAALLHAAAAALAPALFLPYLGAWCAVAGLVLIHVAAGLLSAGADARLYLALLHVPRYAFWKLALRHRARTAEAPEEWIRTTRETDGTGEEQPTSGTGRNTISPNLHR